MINKQTLYIVLFLLFCNKTFAAPTNTPLIKQAENYLNTLHNVSAQFVQNSNRNEQSGNFILSNTHNVRWEYTKPRNIVITFCNSKITYHDKDLDNKDTYSINNPFIEFIATRPITLKSHKGFFIHELKDKNTEFELVISNTQKSVGSFILAFNKQPMQLTKLVLFDDFGTPIEISFKNLIRYQPLLKVPLFHCEIENEQSL